MPEVAPVLMVFGGEALVEAELVGGGLVCPSCSGVLAPWGFARRRSIRLCGDATMSLRPRRSKCRACTRTHVLLPDLCLVRRQYEVAVIGAVLEARARGCGYRRIAAELGVPVRTVRRWLGRFAGNAEAIRSLFTRWAFALDPELGPITPAGGLFDDALEAIGVAVRAWVLRLGRDRAVWPLVAFLSGGLLLATRGDLFPAVR
jgi:uncharacterized protein DUF6431/Homeodomain-like domain-containing protein